eukprot:UN28162
MKRLQSFTDRKTRLGWKQTGSGITYFCKQIIEKQHSPL